MYSLTRRSRHSVNVWPGFVDALASVLLVFVFMLLIFVVGQFFLTDILLARDQALDELKGEILELSDVLSMERHKGDEKAREIAGLNEQLKVTLGEQEKLFGELARANELAQVTAGQLERVKTELEDAENSIHAGHIEIELKRQEIVALRKDLQASNKIHEKLKAQMSDLDTRFEQQKQALSEEQVHTNELAQKLAAQTKRSRTAEELVEKRDTRVRKLEAQVARMNLKLDEERAINKVAYSGLERFRQQIAALNEQIKQLSGALDFSKERVKNQQIKLEELGARLNLEMARRVEELSRYRSEFFGRLRDALGEHPDISIVGDRFLLQSELLFTTGSSQLGADGKGQLKKLAETLKTVADKIPNDIRWVLRVDGHTDRRPINTREFPSNWHLSTARALSIVQFLIDEGIPPNRLAATGFGEFHPLDETESVKAYSKNRRIELKLTER